MGNSHENNKDDFDDDNDWDEGLLGGNKTFSFIYGAFGFMTCGLAFFIVVLFLIVMFKRVSILAFDRKAEPRYKNLTNSNYPIVINENYKAEDKQKLVQ